MTTLNQQNQRSFLNSLNELFNKPTPQPKTPSYEIVGLIISPVIPEKKKPVYKPEFFKTFVKIGWESYEIFTATDITETTLFGVTFEVEGKSVDFIKKDGEILFIKKDFQGNKYLTA